MKILLVSNVSGGIDSLVGLLEAQGSTVVAKEVSSGAREMATGAYRSFSNGKFDIMVVHTDNPVAANAAFNKINGASAVVCMSAADASEARANDANVIILKGSESNFASVIKAATESQEVWERTAQARPQRQKQQIAVQQHAPVQAEKDRESPVESMQKRLVSLFPKKQEQPKYREQEPSEDSHAVPGRRRPGMMGWLKDELGIIDDGAGADTPSKSGKKA